MKTNKGGGVWIFPGSSVYQEDKFEEDAEMVVAFYRERGYLQINVGEPTLKPIRDSKDGKQRFMTLEIPISEGERYKVNKFEFAGNDKVPADIMRPFFKMKTGDYYNEKLIREGFQKIQEIYGAGGHFEMTPYPEFVPEGDKVNVTIRINEGKQYFINRITFQGNTTTRDSVIRRELRLYENSVYNTEALKYSVKRLNQLGYFKPLEDQKNITTEKTPGADNKVDVTLKLEEQNRNQLSFGAGVSQYDGIFGQLSFSTANFMGRGETLTVSMQTGARVSDYQIAFTEPFLFDRPITGSVDLHKRDIEYLYQFTQGSTGGNVTMGYPAEELLAGVLQLQLRPRVRARPEPGVLRPALRLFDEDGCQTIDFDNLTAEQRQIIEFSPYLKDALLIGQGGKPHDQQVHADVLAQLDRQSDYPDLGPPVYGVARPRRPRRQHELHQSDARRHVVPSAHVEDLSRSARPAGIHQALRQSRPLPIFERLVLGGGYSVRGYDLRSIGPKDPQSSIVIGGNKSLLFNAEYLIAVGGPVRLILFYDAGQVQNSGEPFQLKGHFEGGLDGVYVPGFITSTGAEIRFFMPVLNVPFRLSDGARLEVISGDFYGTSGPALNHWPISGTLITLEPDRRVDHLLAGADRVFFSVLSGEVTIVGQERPAWRHGLVRSRPRRGSVGHRTGDRTGRCAERGGRLQRPADRRTGRDGRTLRHEHARRDHEGVRGLPLRQVRRGPQAGPAPIPLSRRCGSARARPRRFDARRRRRSQGRHDDVDPSATVARQPTRCVARCSTPRVPPACRSAQRAGDVV